MGRRRLCLPCAFAASRSSSSPSSNSTARRRAFTGRRDQHCEWGAGAEHEIMTPMEVTMQRGDAVCGRGLDDGLVETILLSGYYSRFPVHEPHDPDSFVELLLIKKLLECDPAQALDHLPLTPSPHQDHARGIVECQPGVVIGTGRATRDGPRVRVGAKIFMRPAVPVWDPSLTIDCGALFSCILQYTHSYQPFLRPHSLQNHFLAGFITHEDFKEVANLPTVEEQEEEETGDEVDD
ncbi:hypothetical protein B0H14DRAFT_2584419 [Mycena olivaceomarginata]|nr:hypothetical protein B0H14DRAFT_2584419 [Mycena olivaceomarginata]